MTRRRNPFRSYKRAGIKAREAWAEWRRGRMAAAQHQGWLASELACTLADDWEQFVKAYGGKAAAAVALDAAKAATTLATEVASGYPHPSRVTPTGPDHVTGLQPGGGCGRGYVDDGVCVHDQVEDSHPA